MKHLMCHAPTRVVAAPAGGRFGPTAAVALLAVSFLAAGWMPAWAQSDAAATASTEAPAKAKGKASSKTGKKSATKAPRVEPVTLNFVNAEIEGVARAMSIILKQQFVVDPRVKGAITLYNEIPIPPREAYFNFLTALRGLGFTVVEVGGLFKIVPEADAKLQSAAVELGEATQRGDVVLTQIFKLTHENPNNLVAILRPLISPNNIINANPGNNSLVITDYADNLARMGKIIAALDTAGASDMEIIPIKHAAASDISALMQRFIDGGAAGVPGGPTSSGTTIVVDPRSNSLIVRAPNAARLAHLRAMIDKLDRPLSGNAANGNIWVVYLKNADATKLATVLRAAFSANSSGGAGGGSSGSTPVSSPTPSPSPLSQLGAASAGNMGGASAQATAPLSPSAGPSTGGFIQADPSTNSLIITAPEPLYRQLRAVIDQLDGRRAQVYIESMIVKVDAEKITDIGVQWQGISGQRGDATIVGGGTNFGKGAANIVALSAAAVNGKAGLANVVGGVPAGFNIGLLRKFGEIYTLGALANFLETNADGNILSTPNLVALDNEEAKIVIGQNVPFITGSFSNAGGSSASVNPFQTIERKDVGLTLKVKPQIGEGGNVRLTIYQENSSVVSGGTTAAGPITDKSAIETSVTVDDGQILVLGGLLKEEFSDGASKVPLLGSLPVVGRLFRNDSRKRSKTNLMVFLRPVVMRTQAASDAITMDRYDSIRATLPPVDAPKMLTPTVPRPAPETPPAGNPGR